MAVYQQVLTDDGFVKQEQLHFPFEERGLQFGDGIYEVIRIYNGHYYLLTEHIDRLYRSAKAIRLHLPFRKQDLCKQLLELLEVNHVRTDAKLYLQATRGSAPRDHAFPNAAINFYAYIEDLPRPTENLLQGVETITTPDVRWQHCHIKSLNLLPNVLAKQEAIDHGCFEAIFHNNGKVTECSSSNIYIVKKGIIFTHPETNQILHGCVRSKVKQFATSLSIPFVEKRFLLEDLSRADEVFLSSSTSEIMPVIKIDGYKVATGQPGALTKKLQHAYEQDAGIRD
ncbi:D-amino-acid transaminase [Aquibacillus sediminis]|uniref:D-amino-acid transaminase n=1 Tax=Aquibacillus sediminis TaxID=2574734 RepID=UPI00110902B0|nr:D-amino-acid transaminase [Aquibacillus sediminis]